MDLDALTARHTAPCSGCGMDPARGWAWVNQRRYCHEGESPTCYDLATADMTDPTLRLPPRKRRR